jgi:hypothetical protein
MDRATERGDLGIAADLAGRLAWFWYVHGHFMEGERRAQELLENMPSEPDRPWLRLLIASAQFDYRLGQFDRAAHKLDLAVEHSRRRDEKRLEMWAHAYAATNKVYRMQLDQSHGAAKSAVALAETEGDLLAFGYARMVETGGVVAELESKGELSVERALALQQEMDPIVEVVRNLGERNMIGHLMEGDGLLSFRSGDLRRAGISLDQSIVALTELGTIGCACHSLEVIALCSAELGIQESAMRLIGASTGLREMVGIKVSPMELPILQNALKSTGQSWSKDQMQTAQATGFGLSINKTMYLARETVRSF